MDPVVGNEVEESTIVETSVEAPVQISSDEIARQSGWKPLEEWEGNPEDWVDAKTFNQRGEYMERIKSQSSLIKKLERKLDRQEQTLSELSEHHKRVREAEYAKALNDLKLMKKEALEFSDHERVVEIDDEIDNLKRTKVESSKPTQETNSGTPQEVEDWIEENPWYKEDIILQGAVHALLAEETKNGGDNIDISKTLAKVTKMIKEEFPNKFGRKNKQIMPVAEPGTSEASSSTKSSKYSGRHLNDLQKSVAKRFIAAGAVKSYDEYAQQLADIGELDAQRGVK